MLFYVHGVEVGYGYMAAPSWVFLRSMLVGAASPLGIKLNNLYYTVSWRVAHVSLAALAVVKGLFHAYIAVCY